MRLVSFHMLSCFNRQYIVNTFSKIAKKWKLFNISCEIRWPLITLSIDPLKKKENFSWIELFQRKIRNHFVEDINGKFQRSRVKFVGIPEGFAQKNDVDSRGINAKSGEFQEIQGGVMVKSIGVSLQNNRCPQHGV